MSKLKYLLSAAAFALGTSGAMAQEEGLGGVAENVRTGLLGPVGDFLLAASFILGVIAAIYAIGVLFKNNKNPHDPSASPMTAVKFGAAAALLIALPTFLGLNVETFFGGSAETSAIEGTLRSIN